MPAARRYCLVVASSALALVATSTAVNFAVDPFGMYRVMDTPGLNARKPAVYQRVRLAKAYEVRRVAPRAIVLGTSRSHLGLRPDHPGWSASPTYNLAFDGATTREMYAYLVHANSAQSLSQVVLGLDSWHLSNAPSGTRPGFDPGVLLQGTGALARLRAMAADLRVLTSLDTLLASARTVRDQEPAGPEWLAPNGQRIGHAFFRRAGELFHDESPRAYFDAYDREEIRWHAPPPAGSARAERPDPAESSLAWIYRIVDYCRTNRIDLRIYITPAHAHQLEMAAAAGETDRIEAGTRALVEYLAHDAARYTDRAAVPLWDFSNYSSVTTEALPPAGSHAEMRYYWDSSHFKDTVGDWVLDRLLGRTSASTEAPPADFGVLLTPEKVDAAVAANRIARESYVRDHPADVAQIEALVAHTLGRPIPHHEVHLAANPAPGMADGLGLNSE